MDNRTPSEDVGPSPDTIAGATGGTGGAVAGAALGSLAGPIGTIIGGLAGAVGGWWAGKSLADSPAFSPDDDEFYQSHHQSNYGAMGDPDAGRLARRQYDQVRSVYQLGHLAGANPDYQNRDFHEIEPHLHQAYSTAGQDDWSDVRQYAQDAWARGRDRSSAPGRVQSADSHIDGDRSASISDTPLGSYGRKLRDDV